MKRLALFLTSILALIPAVAQANDWYFGASAGSARYPSQFLNPDPRITQQTEVPGFGGTQTGLSPSLGLGPAPSMSTSATGYDLFLGYRLSAHWALEAHYLDMGSVKATQTFEGIGPMVCPTCFAPLVFGTETVTAETSGLMVSAVGSYPFTAGWSAFISAGVLAASTKVTTTVAPASIADKASKSVLDYGVGMQYTTGVGWAFRLGWQQLHDVGDANSTGAGSVDFLSLSALVSL